MSKKDTPGRKFLSNFLNRPYGSKSLFGINLPEFGFSEKFDTNIPQPAPTTTPTDPYETQLGDPLNRGQYNRDFRNMLLTNTILRDYELGREAKRNMAAAKQYFEMAGAAQETAARRRLMEDQFSPTKISQQRLRAQQGEAALMNAIANQASAGAQIGSLGTGRRFGK